MATRFFVEGRARRDAAWTTMFRSRRGFATAEEAENTCHLAGLPCHHTPVVRIVCRTTTVTTTEVATMRYMGSEDSEIITNLITFGPL